jgi:hypothetical protein
MFIDQHKDAIIRELTIKKQPNCALFQKTRRRASEISLVVIKDITKYEG